MIEVNPSPPPVDPDLVAAYQKLAPATLGHILETAMESSIQPVWRANQAGWHRPDRPDLSPDNLRRC